MNPGADDKLTAPHPGPPTKGVGTNREVSKMRKVTLAIFGVVWLVIGCARAGAEEDPSKGTWHLDTSATTSTVNQGQKGKVALAIMTKEGIHVSPDAPLKIELTSNGLKLDKATLAHADAVDPKAPQPRFEVPFVAEQKGAQTVDANMTFFVCSEKWCLRQKEKVTLKVDVK
jgi:hypothetical protein